MLYSSGAAPVFGDNELSYLRFERKRLIFESSPKNSSFECCSGLDGISQDPRSQPHLSAPLSILFRALRLIPEPSFLQHGHFLVVIHSLATTAKVPKREALFDANGIPNVSRASETTHTLSSRSNGDIDWRAVDHKRNRVGRKTKGRPPVAMRSQAMRTPFGHSAFSSYAELV